MLPPSARMSTRTRVVKRAKPVQPRAPPMSSDVVPRPPTKCPRNRRVMMPTGCDSNNYNNPPTAVPVKPNPRINAHQPIRPNLPLTTTNPIVTNYALCNRMSSAKMGRLELPTKLDVTAGTRPRIYRAHSTLNPLVHPTALGTPPLTPRRQPTKTYK